MRYVEVKPTALLANHLECVWFVTDEGNELFSRVPEKVLPDGCLEWIFHLGEPFQASIGVDNWERQPRSFVVGELTRFLLLRPTGSVSIMSVRFRPGSAYRFLPFPLELLTDKTLATAEIWGLEGKLIEDVIFTAPSDCHRKELAENFLLRKLAGIPAHPRFEAAVGEIMRSSGQARVDELARLIGWSPRQLEREFRVRLGLPPKALARIIRFQNLLRLVGEETLREWAGLALEAGYCDQSHMVREFRNFTGCRPCDRPLAAGMLAPQFVSPRRLRALLGAA